MNNIIRFLGLKNKQINLLDIYENTLHNVLGQKIKLPSDFLICFMSEKSKKHI